MTQLKSITEKPQKINDADLTNITKLAREHDVLTRTANICILRAKLAEALFDDAHNQIIEKYGLMKGDTYDESGTIIRSDESDKITRST